MANPELLSILLFLWLCYYHIIFFVKKKIGVTNWTSRRFLCIFLREGKYSHVPNLEASTESFPLPFKKYYNNSVRPNSPAPLTDNWKVTDDSSVNFHDMFFFIFCQIIAKNEEKHIMEIYGWIVRNFPVVRKWTRWIRPKYIHLGNVTQTIFH